MSQAAFPYASDAWAFISRQPFANEIGPLGQRAGLDITELYPNVIRMYPFPDARSWVNVGTGADTDFFTQDSIESASLSRFSTTYMFVALSGRLSPNSHCACTKRQRAPRPSLPRF